MKLLQRILQRVVLRPRSGARFLLKQRQGALPSIFGAKKACFLQVSSETTCFLQRKLLPVVICLSHGLSCSKKRFHARFLPGPPSSKAKATGRPMSRRRASKRQAGGEQAGSRQPRQTAAGRASRRQGRQARKQADKQAGRQAGRQADKQAGRQAGTQASRQAALMGRKSKAGRNVNPPFLLEGRV